MLTVTIRRLAFVAVALGPTSFRPALAVDFESFLFNDGNGTELDGAANTANPGNSWTVDVNNLTVSAVESGSLKIAKDNNNAAPAVLNISNISTGTRYIAVDLTGWAFRGFEAGEPEELRFGFLNEDDGAFTGNTITAQMQIARNDDTQAIELTGDAVGVGSSDLARVATFGMDQSAPFKMVLQLDKSSNTFEVFYKNGVNPAQSLGLGEVAASRNGNAVRLFVNNNFGSDFTEFISIDRIAVTDVNPIADLFTLEVNRNTGAMKLLNSTGASLSGLESYKILSPRGALSAAGWKTITGNYDSVGNGSVDVDNAWGIDVANVGELSESVNSGNGGDLTIGEEVVLSMGAGAWVRSPIEDLYMELQFTGGVVRSANVNFVGNGGARLAVGDLNFDGSLTAADWTIFVANSETDLTGLSGPSLYQRGDLDLDGVNSVFDFGIFKNAYDAVNGAGAFEAMLAAVPEPGGTVLLALGGVVFAKRRRPRPRTAVGLALPVSTWVNVLLAAICVTAATNSNAAVLDDFTFSDSNGTTLENVANSANPGNEWNEDDENEMSPSSVLGGAYRIAKNNDAIGSNFLDIANVTTGKAWIVAEMSGWSFSSIIGHAEFDSAELEEVRFAFLNNDTNNQGGSTITGQAILERNSSGGVQLVGKLTTGAPEIAALPLSLARSTPFSVVLEIDEGTESFSVYYKDASGPYTSLGTAPHVAGRNGNSVRFYVNNNFGGTGEFVDINRLYVTTTSPFEINTDALTLRVNTTTGAVAIVNESDTPFDVDLYRIESTTNRLNPVGWNSLSDQNFGAVDGPDGGGTPGDGIGETWDEAGGADAGVLSEMFLLGSSNFAANSAPVLIGNAFIPGSQSPLIFQYRNATTGALLTGNIDFVTGGATSDADFNNDLLVDGVDLLIWQRNLGVGTTNLTGDADGNGQVNAADLTIWRTQYGSPPPTNVASAAAPEPMGSAIAFAALASAWPYRRRWLQVGRCTCNSKRQHVVPQC